MRRLFALFALLVLIPLPAAHAVPGAWGSIYGGVSSTPTRLFLTATGAQTFAVPVNWNSTTVAGANPYANKVECLGAGTDGNAGTVPQRGGPGGGYAGSTNLTLTPGGSASYTIGTDLSTSSFFNGVTCAGSSICAQGGVTQTGQIGAVTFQGGITTTPGAGFGGGGGAAGFNGAGVTNTNGAGGNADNGSGGAGGALEVAGGNGTEWDASHGSGGGGGGRNATTGGANGGSYGGGGGAGNVALGGGAGIQGLCVVTYYALL